MDQTPPSTPPPKPKLRTDPAREQRGPGWTGVVVFARRSNDEREPSDLAELDKDSLVAWLRSEGETNRLAENVIGYALGHGALHPGATLPDGASWPTPDAPLAPALRRDDVVEPGIPPTVETPECPDCGKLMEFIDVDMESQGGPPPESWLCTATGCGRVLPAGVRR